MEREEELPWPRRCENVLGDGTSVACLVAWIGGRLIFLGSVVRLLLRLCQVVSGELTERLCTCDCGDPAVGTAE